jgi:hypothetical protein
MAVRINSLNRGSILRDRVIAAMTASLHVLLILSFIRIMLVSTCS